MELPVTSTVQAELNMEELIWDDAVFIAKDERQSMTVPKILNDTGTDTFSDTK